MICTLSHTDARHKMTRTLWPLRVLIPPHPLFVSPSPVLPFLFVCIMHRLCNSYGSLSFLCLSLSFCVVLPNPYRLSFVFYSSLLCFCCFFLHVVIRNDSSYFSMLMLSASIQSHFPPCPLLFVRTSSHTLTPPQHVIFSLLHWRFLPWLDISFTTPYIPPIAH